MWFYLLTLNHLVTFVNGSLWILLLTFNVTFKLFENCFVTLLLCIYWLYNFLFHFLTFAPLALVRYCKWNLFLLYLLELRLQSRSWCGTVGDFIIFIFSIFFVELFLCSCLLSWGLEMVSFLEHSLESKFSCLIVICLYN